VRARLFSGVPQMELSHFHQLPRYPHERIKRSHRILKDHGHTLAAQFANLASRQFRHVAAVKNYGTGDDLTRRFGDQTH